MHNVRLDRCPIHGVWIFPDKLWSNERCRGRLRIRNECKFAGACLASPIQPSVAAAVAEPRQQQLAFCWRLSLSLRPIREMEKESETEQRQFHHTKMHSLLKPKPCKATDNTLCNPEQSCMDISVKASEVSAGARGVRRKTSNQEPVHTKTAHQNQSFSLFSHPS